jgi:hypothetical protein
MGKTKRRCPSKSTPQFFNTIKAIKPFESTSIPVWSCQGRNYSRKQFGEDIAEAIPQDILWSIESHDMSGCQDLANYLMRNVQLVIENKSHWKVPEASLTNKYPYAGGPPLSYNYTKPSPRAVTFYPNVVNDVNCDMTCNNVLCDALDGYGGVQVILNPSKEHYLHHCEYRKTPEGPCPTCFRGDGRTTWLKGLGHKSSKKTKGMKKITKRQNDFCML